MERIAMEAQVVMTTQMVQVCKEKTMKKQHTSDQLSDAEKTAFQNCVMKYFETPNHIMSSVNQQMQGGGFWDFNFNFTIMVKLILCFLIILNTLFNFLKI